MNVKAEAYQEYNQAAVIDKLFASMPEIVKALAAPLANVDKITIVSTGNGDTAGMNKITGDITKMAAQVPALFETLSGMPLGELLGKVRQIGDKAPRPEEKNVGNVVQSSVVGRSQCQESDMSARTSERPATNDSIKEATVQDEVHHARSLGLSVALGAAMGAASARPPATWASGSPPESRFISRSRS